MANESTYPGLIDIIEEVFNYDAVYATGTIIGEGTCNIRGNAIMAIETTLGENPQGIYADLSARLMAMAADLDVVYTGQFPSGIFTGEISEYATGSGIIIQNRLAVLQSQITPTAFPVIEMEQANVTGEFFRFNGTADATGVENSIVADSDFGTPGALAGWLKIRVKDEAERVPEGDYYVPFYQAPT